MASETLGVLSTATASRRAEPGSPHKPQAQRRDVDPAQAMGALELALLRRSLAGLANQSERCNRCERTMLIGERVYEYESGRILCELCRDRDRNSPAHSHTVHSPEFGHTIRVVDRRAAR